MGDESVKKGDGAMNALPRPRILVAIVIGSLFMVEVGIMSFIHEFAETAHGLMDALILTSVLLPLLYFFIYRPFSRSVKDLKAFSGTLERRVRERTVELEFSEALHRAVVTSSADAIVRINSDGAILMANPAAHRMFGYGKTEFENKHISLLLPDGYERVLVEGFAASLDGWDGHSAAQLAEAVAVTKSGNKLTVECTSSECLVNSEISFVIIMRDVTERKKSEAELISIMEAQPDILYVINTKGALIKWNSALQALCGLTRDQMMERPAADFVCEEDRPAVIEGIKEVLETGSASIEVRFIRHDGALVPHLCNGAAWKNLNGELLGFIGVGKDISERKKAEQAIRESEARYRQLSEAGFEGIVINIEGKVMDCNAAFARMFGYEPEEIIGKVPLDLSPPESHAIIMDHIRRGSEEVYDVVGRKKDGTLFHIEMQGRAITYRGQKARLTAMRDVTERKRNEDLLRASEQKFSRFFTMLPIALGVVTNDGVITGFNARFTEVFGYTVDDIPTIREWWERAYPDESYRRWVLDTWGGAVSKAVQDGTDIEPIEYKVTCKSGAERFVMVGGSILPDGSVLATFVDVTEKKKAEQAIRESEGRYRQLSEASFEGVTITVEGKIVDCNTSFARMFGYTRDGVIGKTPLELVPPESYAMVADHIGRGSEERYEVVGLKKNGTLFPIEVQGRGTVYRGQKARITAVRDITARIEAEKNIRMMSLFPKFNPAPVIRCDADGVIQMANPAALAVFGSKDLSGVKVQTLLSDLGMIDLTSIIRDNSLVYFTTVVNEGYFQFAIKGVAELGVLNIYGSNITERKAAEEKLRSSEENLRKAQEIAHVGNWHWDMVNNTLWWSDEIYRIFGRAPREFGATYDAFLSYVHPDDRARVQQEVNGAIAERSRYDIDHRIILPDGGERIVHEAAEVSYDGMGRALSMVGTVQDITARKTAEDNLRASEQRFRAVAQSAFDAIISINSAGTIIHWNKGAEMMFGLAESEALGKPVEVIIPQRYDEAHRRGFARAAGGGSFRLVGKTTMLEGLRKDGAEFPLELSLAAWEEGGKTYFTGIIRDITERKAAEEALRKSNQLLDAIIENIPNMIFLKKASDLRFELFNRAGEALLGHGRGELLGRNDHDLFPKEQADFFINKDRETLEKNDITDVPEEPIETPAGTRILHTKKMALRDKQGQPQYLLGISEDITDRKRVERALFESESKFRALVEETSDWVWELDGNGVFVYSSPQVREITGYGPEEILGKAPFDFLGRDEAMRVIEFFRATAATQKPFKSFVHTTLHKDGHEIVIETSGVPRFSAEGRYMGYRGINRDITERKAAEEKLKAAKEEAEEATKLKDKFVSLVSHDLKTPLSSMIGFLKLVRNDYAEPLNEGANLILDRAAESGEAMVHLIDDLLTISRFKTGQLKLKRQFFDAEYLGVMMAANYSHLAAQKGIAIESTIPANYRIYGDKTLLTEAIQNLVTNSIKFCKSGDRITISAETAVPPVISVRDTGPGIPPAMLTDLFKFEKKTSTRGTAGETGTGFGLPLVKEIMQLHGGELEVDSEPGNGCLFSLKLPYVRPKILLVDDDKNSRLLQIRRMAELNADFVEAENGQDALNVMEGIRLDLVITDIQMPVMDGLELLKRIKGTPETKDIPVIVMSGEFGMEMRDTIFKFGGDDFVTKKVDKADFFPRVRRFIG